MSFLINPFAFAVAGGDFESIATVTVGSGGAANIEFTSIPGTYQHLQIRLLARGTRVATGVGLRMQVGETSADTGSNYASHRLWGNGSSASAAGFSTASNLPLLMGTGLTASTATANVFGAAIIDILDYADTSKNKTVRCFTGQDQNGDGLVEVPSGLWLSTDAVGLIKLFPGVDDFAQHSTAALFGVKAP